ncbi:ArsR/SmtB family transcription factor [Ekhidna sp.]|uniref:ArsR/SmtB family transcription factor n=1 Tax=Ekhidna sp. TaxID=2608089 RepID=UPI003BACEEF3
MEQRRDIFQAIADPTRREILSTLIEKPKNLNALADQFSISRQGVSLHVKVLEECDMISISKEGRERYCHIKPEKLLEIIEWLEPFKQLWRDRFDQLDDLLKSIK